MKMLIVRWQRLLSAGQTCPRCEATGEEVEKAVATLRTTLAPLGVEVALERDELTAAEFELDPLQSNRIWLNDRLLEDWLGAATGQSLCCDVCGPNDCRTIDVDGTVYETVPAELIAKAGLAAATRMLTAKPGDGAPAPSHSGRGCCSP